QTWGTVLTPDIAGIWNLETGKQVRAIAWPFRGGKVSPDGSATIVHYREAGGGSSFRFLDMKSGTLSAPIRAQHVEQIDHFLFSADGKRLVTIGFSNDGQSFTAWDVPSRKMLHHAPAGKHPFISRTC